MTIKIEAHERAIGDIFSDAYEFEIPPYQRPYAWEEEQARELLNDLLDAMDNRDASGGLYFLGSIVLVKLPTEAQAKVIDGQQRLTTLTILLSVLRDLTTDLERRIERRGYVYQRVRRQGFEGSLSTVVTRARPAILFDVRSNSPALLTTSLTQANWKGV